MVYPHGYQVSVSGGVVRSAPGANRVAVTSEPGAATVAVTITPS